MRIRTVLAAATLTAVTILGGAGVAAADDDGNATGTGQHAANGMTDDVSQLDSPQDRPDGRGDSAQERPDTMGDFGPNRPDGRGDSAQNRPDTMGDSAPDRSDSMGDGSLL